MRDIGPLEIALIVGAIVLIFGVGKLGEIGGALGKSIHDFRRERDKKDDDSQSSPAQAESDVIPTRSEATPGTRKACRNCGYQMSDKAKFCMACGTKL